MDEFSSLDPDYLYSESQKDIEDYLCCICQLIPNYHSVLEEKECGHLFCSDCMSNWLKKSDKCPFCKKKITTRNVEKENKLIYRSLINLVVKCQKENCNWKGPWNELGQHLKKEHDEYNDNINYNVVFEPGEVYKSTLHNHKMQFLGSTKMDWKCDGNKFGKCKSTKQDGKIVEVPQFKCAICNFNLCEKCMRANYDDGVPKNEQIYSKDPTKDNNQDTKEDNKDNSKDTKEAVTDDGNDKKEPDEENVYKLNKYYLSKAHDHLLKYVGTTKVEWFCNGKYLKDSTCEMKDYKLHSDMPKFRCEKCDFDLCLDCMNKNLIKSKKYIINTEYTCSKHQHPLIYMGVTNSNWKCDGNGLMKNCISGITKIGQAEGMPRFRCEKCDFDLCINCFDYYSNIENSTDCTLF